MKPKNMPAKKNVMTWVDLEEELLKLQEFHQDAIACIDDMLHATFARDPAGLKAALDKWEDLRNLGVFTVDRSLYDTGSSVTKRMSN